jgi:hypothetical protein
MLKNKKYCSTKFLISNIALQKVSFVGIFGTKTPSIAWKDPSIFFFFRPSSAE